MNARILLKDAEEKKSFVERLELDAREILVETVDRFAPDHAVLMNPTCQDALVVAKQQPEVRMAETRAFTDQRHLYITRGPEAWKILMSRSGEVDVSPSRCFVLKRAA